MRRAMAEAEVGDAVFSDDPTVNRLEAVIAERLGMERALFVPSGTMSNQIGVGTVAGPGEVVLCSEFAHIARWEGGGAAATFGVSLVQVAGGGGLPTTGDLEAHRYGPHPKAPVVAALALENTHNWAGGRVFSAAQVGDRIGWAKAHGLAVHIDGARLFNAAIATGGSVADLVAGADTVSVCFSKGLGAPIGSCLVGRRDLMTRADRIRQRLGGGMRQAGILAAAALFALEHHVDRLVEDHQRARVLADALVRTGVGQPLHPIESNIVQFRVADRFGSSQELVQRAIARGVTFFPTGPMTARLVTHLDLDDAAIARAVAAFEAL
ncbi:MAG: low specificity L-threonine aldolase [Deltaproteobacteria bacterium]|nr:low specificity L-threonine aldolase [Deltaproteobacteria bacterium]